MLYVDQVARLGRGVFSDRSIKRGELIERAPVLVLPAKDVPLIDRTRLYDYYFDWDPERGEIALGLGHASMYNHSFEPNACYELCHDALAIDIIALRNIAPGQQILVNYNGDPDDKTPLWQQSGVHWIDPPAQDATD